MPTFFTNKTLSFLRALARNNDREWFKARREQFEAEVRGPLVALVDHLAADMAVFAPELACSPRESLFKQYRDTRFSEDKSPLKTNIAAVFPVRELARLKSAGLYVQIDAKEIWMGGGLYHAPSPDLRAVREHVSANFTRFRAIVESPSFRRRCGAVGSEGESLTRVPRGFSPDNPAAEYLKLKNILVSRTFPSSLAATPRFYTTLVAMFADIAPMVRLLNEPLIAAAKDSPLRTKSLAGRRIEIV